MNEERIWSTDTHQILLGLQVAITKNAQWYQQREMMPSAKHQKAQEFYKLALEGHRNYHSAEVPDYALKAHKMLESDTKGNIPPIPNYEERHLRRIAAL